jgi:hypothetical protein
VRANGRHLRPGERMAKRVCDSSADNRANECGRPFLRAG